MLRKCVNLFQMTKQEIHQVFVEGLKNHVPHKALPIVATWLAEHRVHFKIARKRVSKFGDYRAPYRGKGHRISVNGDLNPYHFLEVLTHEVAHLQVKVKYPYRALPHGIEWQMEYCRLMNELLDAEVFPDDLKAVISWSMIKPAASCVDTNLYKAFKKYDQEEEEHPHLKKMLLEDLAEGTRFVLANGEVFLKGKKLRKRFKCLNVENQKWYRVSPIAEIYVLKKKD